MGTCKYCSDYSEDISNTIGFCVRCIRKHFDIVWPEIRKIHQRSRRAFGLPEDLPRAKDGIICELCANRCQIPDGEPGFCGIRRVENNRLKGGRPHEGNLYYYYDQLPTNCVGNFVCPGGTGCGYPRYAFTKGPEYGYRNLAVFYHSCSFNCLYCQNYHFKEHTFSKDRITSKELANAADPKTSCICFFGGDPGPQVLHAIKASKIAIKNAGNRILRICWETNGAVQEPYLSMMADLSLKSGGCIKFDLKAWDERIHFSLCGVSNKNTIENFQRLSRLIEKRQEPPFLIASSLLVPGYVDKIEIQEIARFISKLNPDIPYSLLAFYPHFYLKDLPLTSRSHAFRCKEAAENAGLRNVHIGNLHLLR